MYELYEYYDQTNKYQSTRVILIFGVTGTSRWQGYATMISKAIPTSDNQDDKFSPTFQIQWEKRYDC